MEIAFGADSQGICTRPVGFVRVSISSNEQKFVSLPFRPFDPSVNSVLGGQLTGSADEQMADSVLRWDSVALRYNQAFKADGTGNKEVDGKWFSDFDTLTNSPVALEPGEGFVIWNRQGQLQDIYLAGEVVLDVTNKVVLDPSLNLVGYPYSSGGNAPSNMVFTSDSGTGYTAAVTLEMGRGYWVRNTNSSTVVWAEVRPYAADVFPPQGVKPEISCINVNTGVGAGATDPVALVLTIDCDGLAGNEKLDVYYKDLFPADVFRSDKDWLIAETDIPLNGRKTIDWSDRGNSSRKPANEVFSRYYLIGLASVDENHNGIPDAREKFVFNKVLKGPLAGGSSSINLVTKSPGLSVPLSSSRARIIYVDRKNGADRLTGRNAVVVGSDGPKKTIKAGLDEAVKDGGTLIIKTGVYGESLNVSGRNVRIVIQGKVRL